MMSDSPPSNSSVPGPVYPPWLSRLPLNYLGLWGCDINFERMELLAHNIAGNRDARQMLVSAKRWRNEPAMAAQIWNAIFDFLRNNNDTCVFLEECILTFNKYYRDGTYKLPLILSANMFYLVHPLSVNPNDRDEPPMDHQLKQKSLRCLIRCINFNIDAVRVIRNCLLTMSKFQLPDDLLFIYEISAQTMLKVLLKYHVTPEQTRPEDAQFLTNMVIQFANQFVCQVDLNLKLATRRIKFIDTICIVIEKRLDDPNRFEADDPLKGCWSCLWNVTDETPSNSERFIEKGGVQLFLRCLEKYPNDTDLKRNIMGLVGNIAEVEYLRKHLIREDTINFYCDALISDASDGLEVAYNACGTLSHILSDQKHVWPESLLEKKAEITDKMIKAIEKWDEAAERNINYRSLRPIIHLIRCHHCVEAQTWATWALASLTHREEKSGKYIGLTIEEGGYEALEELIQRNQASPFILNKAKTVLGRVKPRFLEIENNMNNLNN